MAERSLFFNSIETAPGVFDREYQAQDFTSYLKGVATTGILRDPDNVDGLKVSVVGNSMDVNIAEGLAYVEGHYYEIYNEPLKLTLNTPEPQYDRIDRIVLRLDLRLSGRHVKAFVKEGVSSASPVAPDLERSELVYELSLAQIRLRKNTSSLQAGDVTDERGDPDLCPWVSSKIIPNYNDDTLQAVLDGLNNHKENPVIHTFYGVSTGSANVKTISLSPAPTSLADGMAVVFKNNIANTGATTLNVNGFGNKSILRSDGKPLTAGMLVANGIYTVRYNSTTGNFILQGERGFGFSAGTNNLVNYAYGQLPITNANTWTRIAGFKVGNIGGLFRLRFTAIRNLAHTILLRYHVNGTPVGDEISIPTTSGFVTYSQDISADPGDVIDLHAYYPVPRSGSAVSNLAIGVQETMPQSINYGG